jgi:hypothetical protein
VRQRLQKRLAVLDEGAKNDLNKGLTALNFAITHMSDFI